MHNLQQGIADVSNSGYYHNKKFRETAEAHGLIIEKYNIDGWTITTLTPETEAWLADTLGNDVIHVARLPEGGGKGKTVGRKSKNRSIKYVCPECGTISALHGKSTSYTGIARRLSRGRDNRSDAKAPDSKGVGSGVNCSIVVTLFYYVKEPNSKLL